MLKKLKNIVNNLPIILVVFIAGVLRLQNLGYSDYQGDEIKAFVNLSSYSNIGEFLLNQRKGPGQFLITYLIKFINPNYTNELITRLPFALAGVAAVYFFYKLVSRLFNEKIAFYASFFFATNGFFVALSRIVQYQAFVILFMIMALYYLHLAVTESDYKFKGIKLGILFWSLSILFHYDGIFIAPLALYFVYIWLKKFGGKLTLKNKHVKFLRNVILFNILLLSAFYVPFIINIGQNTLSYWAGRISGEVSSKISSSKYLFTVYQPIYVVHFYVLLTLAGMAYIARFFLSKLKKLTKLLEFFPEYPFEMWPTLALLAWFAFPLIILEGFVYIPGTHIYAYLLPLTIILALGIFFTEKLLLKFKNVIVPNVISYTFIALLFAFIFLQSYVIYVDHNQEYPWESEKFLIWQFHKPTPIFHLSMFGFPYYRNWEGIAAVIASSENNGYYSTNERKSIARFHVPLEKDTDSAGYYIHILNPQSFTNAITQDKAQYWSERYPPVFTFSKSGKDLVRVYYMEAGSLAELQKKGY